MVRGRTRVQLTPPVAVRNPPGLVTECGVGKHHRRSPTSALATRRAAGKTRNKLEAVLGPA